MPQDPTDLIELPDEIYSSLEEEHARFEENKEKREQLKDEISEEKKDEALKVLNDANVKANLDSNEKRRYNLIGETMLSEGSKIVEKITSKQLFKEAMSIVQKVHFRPLSLTKKIADSFKNGDLFRVLSKMSIALLLGYAIVKDFFSNTLEKLKDISLDGLSYVMGTIVPWVGWAFTTTKDIVQGLLNTTFDMMSGDGNLLGNLGKIFGNNVGRVLNEIFKKYVPKPPEGSDENKRYEKLALDARRYAAKTATIKDKNGEEKVMYQQTEEQKKTLEILEGSKGYVSTDVVEMFNKGSDIQKLVIASTGGDSQKIDAIFDEEGKTTDKTLVTAGDNFVKSIEAEASPLINSRDAANNVISLADTIKSQVAKQEHNRDIRQKIERMKTDEFVSKVDEALKATTRTEEQEELLSATSQMIGEARALQFKNTEELSKAFSSLRKQLDNANAIIVKPAEEEFPDATQIIEKVDEFNDFLSQNLSEVETDEESPYSSNKVIWKYFNENNKDIIDKKNDLFGDNNSVSFFGALSKFGEEILKVITFDLVNDKSSKTINSEEDANIYQSFQGQKTKTTIDIHHNTELQKSTERGYQIYQEKIDSIKNHLITIIDKAINLQKTVLESSNK